MATSLYYRVKQYFRVNGGAGTLENGLSFFYRYKKYVIAHTVKKESSSDPGEVVLLAYFDEVTTFIEQFQIRRVKHIDKIDFQRLWNFYRQGSLHVFVGIGKKCYEFTCVREKDGRHITMVEMNGGAMRLIELPVSTCLDYLTYCRSLTKHPW